MPVVTARDIIQDALELMGIYSPGDTISAADLSRSLSTLNDMMDVWSNESLATFDWITQTFPLVPGQFQYTIGPASLNPDIVGERPLRVSDAPGSAYLLDNNLNRYLMDVVDQLTWNIQTTAVANSDLPDHLFYDPQFPLGIINVWPTPSVGYTCSFLSYHQLGNFQSAATVFSLPPGYKRAVTTNLCLSLKPYFVSGTLDPLVILEAKETKGIVKRNNMRTQVAVFDPELVSRGNQVYNIYSDRGTGRN
ncbi:MAG TPA: hypothetical protein VNU68_35075 [Verrucomicrobiae bacterium]|nr:hypothetical protein [Verrucomicrobiae bacterium]